MLWLRRIHHVLRRRRFEADLEEELALHLELKQQALREQGVPSETAMAESRRVFGSAALAADQSRDVWTWPWLSDVARDARFAGRLLVKDARFTLSSVVTLALGIGATTTVFVFINTALFKDLPFDHPRELMALGTITMRTAASNETAPRRQGVSYPDFVEWRTASSAFAGLAADVGATVSLSDDDLAPVRARGSYVSGNLFGLLRVQATAGRTLAPDDDRPYAPLALVLGNDIWQRRFHGDVGAVGRHVRVNGTPAVIVGVMPSAFRFPGTSELWLPLSTLSTLGTTDRARRTLNVTGRLQEGRSVPQALAELTSVAERLEHDFPETNTGVRPTVAPPLDVVRRGSAPLLYALFGAVCFVLLISCANVATLLLARVSARAREMSIRASLGATRGRLVRQLLIESLALAILAAVVGVAIAFAGVHVFGVMFDAVEIAAPTQATTPYWVDLSMDARVLAFVTLLCVGVAVTTGVVPAVQMSRADLKEGGHGAIGGRRAGRWMDALMVLELALTVILLSGAALLVRSFVTQYRTDLVVDTRVWSARLTLPAQTYATPAQQDAFLARLEARLGADSRLTSVAFGSDIPIAPLTRLTQPMLLDSGVRESTATPLSVSAIRVGAHYFETLGVGPVAGRSFTNSEIASGQPVAVVDRRFADRFLPQASPIGRRVQVGRPDRSTGQPQWLTIVGVTPALPYFGPDQAVPDPMVFVPGGLANTASRTVSLLVRGGADAVQIAQAHVTTLDPDLPLFAVQSIGDAVARTRYPTRVLATLFGCLALIAVTLATVGLASLTAHGVVQRTQETGVRLALGARRSRIVWVFARRTCVQLGIGLTVGVAGALGLGRAIVAILRDTNPRDPQTLVIVTALVGMVSIIATLIPARRAVLAEPANALRHE